MHRASMTHSLASYSAAEDADQLAGEIAEPLQESAPIAFEAALQLCDIRDQATSCRAYHAIWQYLRVAGMIRAVRSDGPLYVAAAVRLAEQGRLRRVLICGAADYSLLAYLAYAVRSAGCDTEFDVVDLCQTPLRIVAWYGVRRGLKVNTTQADITQFNPSSRYDLICAHSFLAAVAPHIRPMLFRMWKGWLEPQGRICLSSRIDLAPPAADRQAKDLRLESMVQQFFRRRRDLNLALPTDDDRFAELILHYARRGLDRQRGITSQLMHQWCADSRLTLESVLEPDKVVPHARDRAALPLESGAHVRLWFEARRA